MDKNNSRIFARLLFVVIAMAVNLFAGTDPLGVLEATFTSEAENSIFPMVIIGILAFTAIASALSKSFWPIIFGVVASLVIGLSPELIDDFTGYVPPTP